MAGGDHALPCSTSQAMLPNDSFPCKMRRWVRNDAMKRDEARRESGKPLEIYLRECVSDVDSALNRLLPKASAKPATIHRAMRYSLFAGGKRMRPVL